MTAHLSPAASWLAVLMLLTAIACGLYLLHLLTAHAAAEGTGPACQPRDGLMDEYRQAADDLDGFDATDRAFVEALRAMDHASAFDTDGCWRSDHDLGRHSPWRIPAQRDGSAS